MRVEGALVVPEESVRFQEIFKDEARCLDDRLDRTPREAADFLAADRTDD